MRQRRACSQGLQTSKVQSQPCAPSHFTSRPRTGNASLPACIPSFHPSSLSLRWFTHSILPTHDPPHCTPLPGLHPPLADIVIVLWRWAHIRIVVSSWFGRRCQHPGTALEAIVVVVFFVFVAEGKRGRRTCGGFGGRLRREDGVLGRGGGGRGKAG